MAQKRQHPSSSATNVSDADTPGSNPPQIYQSSSIHDRGSIFTAIFSTSAIYLGKPKLLQSHEPFKDAMHRMLAYRRESKQKSLPFSASNPSSTTSRSAKPKSIYVTVSDEDGEKYAGKKLERLLDELDVEGVVVVARWYGGVLLGPVRFEHIVNVAREAVAQWRTSTHGASDERDAKRVKTAGSDANLPVLNVVDEAKQKERLGRVLVERDASVTVLRSLLTEKVEELKRVEASLSQNIVEHTESRTEDGAAENEAGQSTSLASPDTATEHRAPARDSDEIEASQHQPSQPSSSAATESPSAQVDYKGMPLQRLKQLEKARDASLGWILKQIDATEIKIKEAERKVEQSSQIQTNST